MNMALIETAVARASAAARETAVNVFVMDDVTPCYLKAGAALKACDEGLGVALLLSTRSDGSKSGTHDSTGNHHPPRPDRGRGIPRSTDRHAG